MKILPSLPKPPRPTPTEDRRLAAPGFADLLGKQAGGDQVATFSELPVFGRPHAVTAPAVPASHERVGPAAWPAADPSCAAGPAPVPARAANPSPPAPPRLGDTKVCVPKRPHQLGDTKVCVPKAEPDRPALPELRAGEDIAPQAPDAPVESDPLRRARLRMRQAAPKTGISLTLREDNGAVSLIVGQPPLDPEQLLEARRLAERVLAESGLALAHFQLNGTPVGPDSTGKEGKRHGTRSN